jgi:putative component of toxin-antitoxin plasmid stabilization module
VAIRLDDGTVPAIDFLDRLDLRSQAQFDVRVERLAEEGWITNSTQFKVLKHPGKPPVAEIKLTPGPGYRFYCVQERGTWYVTHGAKKPKDNRVPHEVARARTMFLRKGRS